MGATLVFLLIGKLGGAEAVADPSPDVEFTFIETRAEYTIQERRPEFTLRTKRPEYTLTK